MTDIAAIRERHFADEHSRESTGYVMCAICPQTWPCDAAQLLALLADTPSVEPPEEGTVDADGTYHPTAEDYAIGNTAAGHEHWDDR